MNIESQPQEGPKTPDFMFTVSPKTEAFLNSLGIIIDSANLVYIKNNIRIPILYIPQISEGFSNVKVEQVGDARKLSVSYNNGNGEISKIVDLDPLLKDGSETEK